MVHLSSRVNPQRDGYTYEYDYENRVTKIAKSGPNTAAEYVYDALAEG